MSINRERYKLMITNFLWSKLKEVDLDNIWQQDEARCRPENATIELLLEKLENSIILGNCDIVWPLKSCDLTPLD